MKYLTLDIVKKHLNIESEFTDDDSYIELLAEIAEEKVAKELCITVDELATIDGGKEIPKPLISAMLLSLGLYYSNREEATTIKTKPLEQGSKYLIGLYRDHSK